MGLTIQNAEIERKDLEQLLLPQYVPENPYLLRKFTENILPDIKRALKRPSLVDQDPGAILNKIGKVQSLRRLEVLRQHQEKAYKERVQAIKLRGGLYQPESHSFRGEDSLLSSQVKKILPKHIQKLIGKSQRSRLLTEESGLEIESENSRVSAPNLKRSLVGLESNRKLPEESYLEIDNNCHPSQIGQHLHTKFQSIINQVEKRFKENVLTKGTTFQMLSRLNIPKNYNENIGHSKIALKITGSSGYIGHSLPKILRKKPRDKHTIDVSLINSVLIKRLRLYPREYLVIGKMFFMNTLLIRSIYWPIRRVRQFSLSNFTKVNF